MTRLISIMLGATLTLMGCATESTQKKSTQSSTSSTTSKAAPAQPAKSSDDKGQSATQQAGPTSSPSGKSFDAPPPLGTQATCPVSNEPMTVEADTIHAEHAGRHYVLCCPNCKRVFLGNPGRFADASPK